MNLNAFDRVLFVQVDLLHLIIMMMIMIMIMDDDHG